MSDHLEQDPPRLPDELPPVQPPSAGFIVQLFLVPGLIVVVLVGGYLALQRMVSSEQDWRVLVADLQSPHEHLRWRGAFGLAQMLQADRESAGSPARLVTNPEVARHLSDLLMSELKRGSRKDDDLKQQAFLARTLGLFHIPDVVVPALQMAIQPEHDREVRKNALGAIALLAGREAEAGRSFEQPELLEDLLGIVAGESDPLIRQMVAFDLGLFPGEKSRSRLEVLLGDADPNVRANAAVALARQNSAAGLPVIQEILRSANSPVEPGTPEEFQQFLAVRNAVAALTQLAPRLTGEERSAVLPLLQPVAENYRESRIRLDAERALLALRTKS